MHQCKYIWQKLQACLRDAHPSGQAEEKRRGGLIGCFRPRRHSKLASEEELDKAAQYVVARFGAYDNEDEDEEEGAEELEGKVSHQKVLRLYMLILMPFLLLSVACAQYAPCVGHSASQVLSICDLLINQQLFDGWVAVWP